MKVNYDLELSPADILNHIVNKLTENSYSRMYWPDDNKPIRLFKNESVYLNNIQWNGALISYSILDGSIKVKITKPDGSEKLAEFKMVEL